MNATIRGLYKLAANIYGRAVTLRQRLTLLPDPPDAVGIAVIKVVAEEKVQAIAYGRVDSTPRLIMRLNPMGRDSSDLEPFAGWLVAYVRNTLAEGRLPRIWLPHIPAMRALEALGQRLIYDRQSSADLREAAICLTAMANEEKYKGQQLLAIAHTLLLDHVMTGQSHIEDQHLDAVLAWVAPEVSRSAHEVARARSRLPASGVLANVPGNMDDDRIDYLRCQLRRSHDPEYRIRSEIFLILERAVLREWEMLFRARAAYWSLLPESLPLVNIAEENRRRIEWAVENGPRQPRCSISQSISIEDREDAETKMHSLEMNYDWLVRRREMLAGHVLCGDIVLVDQPRPARNPCWVIVSTCQRNLRIRIDDRLQTVGGALRGIVRRITYDPERHRSMVTIEISIGARAAHNHLAESTEWIEWYDPQLIRRKRHVLQMARDRQHWMAVGGVLPCPTPMQPNSADILEDRNRVRR